MSHSTPMSAPLTLPRFESLLGEIAAAEGGSGWLSACEDAGRFLVPTGELVTCLAEFVRSLDGEPIVEVCAGRSELAEHLRSAGVPIVATDVNPPASSPAIRASAAEALRRFQPVVALGCFVPIDSDVDALVMRFPSVRHYVVLGARIGGLFGSAALWRNPAWTGRPLEHIGRWMITRHDVWTGAPGKELLQHGEAWHFRREKRKQAR